MGSEEKEEGGQTEAIQGGKIEALCGHFSLIDAVDGQKKPFASSQEKFMEQFCFIKWFSVKPIKTARKIKFKKNTLWCGEVGRNDLKYERKKEIGRAHV